MLNRTKIIIIAAVFILFIFLHTLKILRPLENSLKVVFLPIEKGIYYVSSKSREFYDDKFFNRNEKKNLLQENIFLKEQVKELTIENINLSVLKDENKNLRDLLNFVSEHKYSYLAGAVIGKIEDEGNILIIDKGERDGLKEGLVVINSKGLVIGKIAKCDDIISQVLLLNDNQSRIAASILGHLETNGVVEGEFRLSMKMDLIPQNIPIKKGDVLITSGLEENIPYGLIIGEVNEVEKNEGDLFQKAKIQPLFPLDNVRIISIILPAK